MSFRPTSQTDDDYTNMMPQISKEINGNFNLLYKRRSTSQRRSNRNHNSIDVESNRSTSLRRSNRNHNIIDVESNSNPTSVSLDNLPIPSANDVEASLSHDTRPIASADDVEALSTDTEPIFESNSNPTSISLDNRPVASANDVEALSSDSEPMLCNYLRCYVEDFMLCSVGEQLLVLVPSHFYTTTTTKWTGPFDSDISSAPFEFTKDHFLGYTGVVSTNPYFDNVSNGMHLSDYASGFGTHNYGSSITFSSSTSSDTESILITWQEVLDGKKTVCKYGDRVIFTVTFIPILRIGVEPGTV